MRTSPPRWRNYGSNDGRARISSFVVGGPVNFSSAKFSGAAVHFFHSKFAGESPKFTGADTSGGTVFFHAAEFSGGTVFFHAAEFSGGTVSFSRAEFSSETVDFAGARRGEMTWLVRWAMARIAAARSAPSDGRPSLPTGTCHRSSAGVAG
jgi:hypothetical protein